MTRRDVFCVRTTALSLLLTAVIAARPAAADGEPMRAPVPEAPQATNSSGTPDLAVEETAEVLDDGSAAPDPHAEDESPALTPEEIERLERALARDLAQGNPTAADPGASNAAVGIPGVAAQSMFTSAVSGLVQNMNPEISLILDVAGAWFSDDNVRQLGGHDPQRTGFTLQQLELAAGASVDPFFRFDTNLVFTQFGVEIEEAYGTTTGLPLNLQARVGQFLTRFGRTNATHPHSWHFIDQVWLIGKFFGAEGNRGLGAELSWLSPLPWFAELVLSVNDASGDCCARSYLGGAPLSVRSPSDLLVTGALKQYFPFDDDWSLLWGLSGQSGPNPTGLGNRTEIFGTDLYLRYRPVEEPGRSSLSLQAEAMLRRRQVPRDVWMDLGYYAQLVYQFALQYEVAARAEGVSGVTDDPLDPSWADFAQRYSLSATYYPSHFSRLRAQVASTSPVVGDAWIWAAMVSVEVLVGAHGSHRY